MMLSLIIEFGERVFKRISKRVPFLSNKKNIDYYEGFVCDNNSIDYYDGYVPVSHIDAVSTKRVCSYNSNEECGFKSTELIGDKHICLYFDPLHSTTELTYLYNTGEEMVCICGDVFSYMKKIAVN